MHAQPPITIQDAARCYAAGDHAGAERCARAIVAADPGHFDALHLLGVLCLNSNRPADALAWLRRAARERPGLPQLNYHLGNALLELRLFDAAETAFRAALRAEPGHYDAINNLANALAGAGRFQEALACHAEALALRPLAAPSHYNVARVLIRLERHQEAVRHLRIALDQAGDAPAERQAEIRATLCQAFVEQKRYPEALETCRDLPAHLADHPAMRWNESLTRLMLGDYAAGWRLYERRFDVPDHDPPRPGAAELDLAAVAGKRVLVFGEQGRGDAIQFARYLPLLAERGATVIAEAYPDLLALFTGMEGVEACIAPGDPPPPHDMLTPLLSLPRAFGTEVGTIPARVPYLQPPPERLAAWSARLGQRGKPRIALSWWGAQHIPHRSIPAAMLAPLLARSGLEFHAVQKEITASDADWLARNPEIQVHAPALRDFADTAALLAQMDLVISIDTAVAHLAGALARPVWIMLPYAPDWRWFPDCHDSPWYPTARLFRQARPGHWPDVIARVTAALDAAFPTATA